MPNWKKVIISGSDAALNSLDITQDLTVDTNTLYVDSSNNRVGIGTTSPAKKFHLEGGIARFDNASSNYLEIDGSNSGTNNAIISNRFNQLQLITNTGGSDPHIALLPGTGGNVGIGTTTPSQTLSVEGNIELGTGGYIYGDTTTPYLRLNNAAGAFLGYSTSYVTVGGPTTVVDASTEVARFRSNKVTFTQPLFVGTTINGTPTAELQVKGAGTTSATTALLAQDSSGNDLLKVNDQGNVTIPNGSLSINGASETETFNILGNMTFDGTGTISAGGVGDSLTLSAQSANIAIGYPGAADITMTGGVSGSFSGSFEGDGTNLTGITAEWDGSLNGDAEITGSLTVKTGDLLVSGSKSTQISQNGEVVLSYGSEPVVLTSNTYVPASFPSSVVASVNANSFNSVHFDYVIVNGTNRRAGTVTACHDGNSNVVFSETSTIDLGSTAGVTLGVFETGGNLQLIMSVPTTGWTIKTYIRAI
mgnify:CR=1 FL=1